MTKFPLLLLLMGMVSIQFGAALAKQLFPLIGAPGVTLLRAFFAALFLAVLWKPWKETWTRQQFQILALYGTSLGIMNLLFYQGLQTVPLGLAVAIEFTGPLGLSLFSSKKPIDILWVILAGVGIFLILPQQSLENPLDLVGVAFVLGAGFFWAVNLWFAKKASAQAHGGKSTSVGMAFAAFAVMPFGVYYSGSQIADPNLFWKVIPLGVLVALLSSAIPYSIEMNALKKIPLKTFGVLMSLEPVVATVAGFLFLHETLTPLQMASIVCIVVASLGSNATAGVIEV